MLNHIVIMGRFTKDPELRRTQSGIPVASFTLAVDRDYAGKDNGEREVDFIDCVAWRQTGEFVAKHFSKGRAAAVSGRLEIRNWTDKEGNKRRNAEVNADSVYFADSKREDNGSSYANETKPAAAQQQPAAYGNYGMLDDDDDQLPF